MNQIEKRIKAMENLQQQMQVLRGEIAKEENQRSILMKKERTRRLIEAGKLFDEAGILDDYDRDEVLDVLKKLAGGKNHGS